MSRRLLYLFLVVATVAVYWPVATFDFTNYDDPEYVTDNFRVRAGLTPSGVLWALTTTQMANWHPLTWLSLMLDAQVGGLDARVFHLTNLLLHLANTLLLFHVLDRMTRCPWRSAFVAALFAVHPLHVESVAWIAERKDVLSTLFWFLTLLAYLAHVERPALGRYLVMISTYALGLMSKPMLVTLPLTLLLLDFWPLKRLSEARPRALILEKAPLLALAVLASILTWVAQRAAGAMGGLHLYPLRVRVENAIAAYADYMGAMLWPHDLTPMVPHPGGTLSSGRVFGSALLLAAVSAVAFRLGRSRPYLVVGWLWYLVTLVPVIGLVQVGMQARADRYTYVPLIGLFLVVAWGVPDLAGRWMRGASLAVAAVAAVVALTGATALQVGHWRDGVSLFQHAVRIHPGNALVQYNLGSALKDQGDTEGAIAHYLQAIRIEPRFAIAHSQLGGVFLKQGRVEEAVERCSDALRLDPKQATAHYNLGLALLRQGRVEEAGDHFSETLKLRPESLDARVNLGVVRAKQGRLDEAIALFEEVLRLAPDHEGARRNLDRARRRKSEPS